MAFLFHPDRVNRLLAVLPSLAKNLPAPKKVGHESYIFDGWRLTDRAVYRLLTNPHYPSLREGLRAIEHVIGAGMSLKELRNEKDRGSFGSFLAEALLADHFLQRGLSVARGSGTGGKPDLEVGASNYTATVEVYSPRTWRAREDWVGNIIDALKNADVPYEYVASVSMSVAAPMHPDAVETIIDQTGGDVLRPLRSTFLDCERANQPLRRPDSHHRGRNERRTT